MEQIDNNNDYVTNHGVWTIEYDIYYNYYFAKLIDNIRNTKDTKCHPINYNKECEGPRRASAGYCQLCMNKYFKDCPSKEHDNYCSQGH